MPKPESERNKFKPERAAAILVEAAFMSDEKAARKWRVSVRSITNWRNRLDDDAEFAAIFHHKKDIFEANWALELLPAIYSAIDYLKRAAQAKRYSHQMIHSIAGALKILSEVMVTKEYLDARSARQRGEEDQALGALETHRHASNE